MIHNPVLPGFHPDPSILCVDGTFYIANSTFEYFPGVAILASRDLANWETVAYPLSEPRLLDMRGNPPSGGIWAPCLSHCDGVFYLVYTDVKTWAIDPFKDAHNYITTATNIEGPWSDPIYVNSSGFDPSLFHDDDGRKFFVNMEWDYRKTGSAQFSGILLTELDAKTLRPISQPKKIFKGSDRGLVEGPHLYKVDGMYYLFTAEGGTEYSHAETVARSRTIDGEYELHPQKHLVTTKDAPGSLLQKTGHGSICQSGDGRWWFAFLCGRPLPQPRTCPLGRETSINEIVWKEGWPYLLNGTCVPDASFAGYGEQKKPQGVRYDFASKQFQLDFMSLRTAAKYDVLKNGSLRLYGGESLLSRHDQNMLVRRQTDFSFCAQTAVTLTENHFQRMAGLIYRYDENNQYYLRVAYDEEKGTKTLGILQFDAGQFFMPLGDHEIPVGDTVHLRLQVNGRSGTFLYSADGVDFQEIPFEVDASKLSDEYQTLGFTGAFVGMCSIDMMDRSTGADYLYFSYTPMDE